MHCYFASWFECYTHIPYKSEAAALFLPPSPPSGTNLQSNEGSVVACILGPLEMVSWHVKVASVQDSTPDRSLRLVPYSKVRAL